MSALLSRVRTTRLAFDEALDASDAAVAAASQQSRRARRLHERAREVRQSAIEHRISIAAGDDHGAQVSPDDTQSSERDAEAADVLAARLAERAEQLSRAATRAEEPWKKAVCAYAQEVETQAIRDIETALEHLSAACARGIAAADISREHGQIRGSHNLGLEKWYGSAGQLVHALRGIEWPTWPNAIDPKGFKVQRTGWPITHPGVEAELAAIRTKLSAGDLG
jgi:hypothetical protein